MARVIDMDRRSFLAAAAAAASLAGPAVAGGPRRRPFITTDVAPLRRVLVHEPGPEAHKILLLASAEDGSVPQAMLGHDAAIQHRSLAELLTGDGAEVLELEGVLDDAIDRARSAGAFEPWLAAEAPSLVEFAPEVTARVLLGGDDAFVYYKGPDGDPCPLTQPMRFALFARDAAFLTPRGAVICHFSNGDRAFEPALLRFAFRWATALAAYPIAFDARREGVFLQGGDAIVADETTLLLGVGNLTDEAAAPRLARALGMDVVAVRLPGGRPGPDGRRGAWNGLRTKFLHLDSVFNLVAERTALAVPYFLEASHAGDDPLTELLLSAGAFPSVRRDHLRHLAESLARVGLVRVFQARTGEPVRSVRGVKLVDYVRGLGYDVIHVGGDPPEHDSWKHVVEHVLREVHFQGANVVATRPGRVLAYEGNPHTLEALRGAGIDVATFRAHELVRWSGGPHCLTLPLERG